MLVYLGLLGLPSNEADNGIVCFDETVLVFMIDCVLLVYAEF